MAINIGGVSLSDLKNGNVDINKVFCGDVEVWSRTNKVPVLRSHGTEYIDTGISARTPYPTEGDRTAVEITIEYLPQSISGFIFFFGSCQQNATKSFGSGVNPSTGAITIQCGSAHKDGTFIFENGNKYVIHQSNNDLYINSNIALYCGISSINGDYNIYLLTRNLNGTAGSMLSVKLYRAKIWKNNTLVRDFIPALDDGVACLYDNVSGTYFHNVGTGEFDYFEEDE